MAEPWLERLVPAQLSGVPFRCDRYELEGGRNVVVHTYPSRDLPGFEELGLEAREHALSAYTIGPDYDLDRDRLIAVLGKRSVGYPFRPGLILRHPWLGVLHVLVQRWRLVEDSRTTRTARFELRLVEIPQEVSATVSADQTRSTSQQPELAAAALESAAAGDVAGELVVEGPESAREASAGALTQVVQAVQGVLSGLTGAQGDVEALQFKATTTIGQVAELVVAPANLASAVIDLARGVRAAASDALQGWRAYRTLLLEARSILPAGRGEESRRAAENARLVDDLLSSAAAAGAVVSAAEVAWESIEDARAARDEILGAIDALAERALSPSLDALLALGAACRASVPSSAENLPHLELVDLGTSLPAVVAAYRLFDDVEREGELVTRNHAVDPARLPAELQVLSGGRS